MIQLLESRLDTFKPCANDAPNFVKRVVSPSDIWFYVFDGIATIRVFDCSGSIIADYDNEHEISPSSFTSVIDAYDSNGQRFTYIREGTIFASLGLDCGACFYYRIVTTSGGVLFSETIQLDCDDECGCPLGFVDVSSRYPAYDHLGRFYGVPCAVNVQYPTDATFQNSSLLCAELRQISLTNTRQTDDSEGSCIAARAGVSVGYTLKSTGMPDYDASNINTILLGNGLTVGGISLLPSSTETFAPLRDCECLFYVDTSLSTCPNIVDLTCSDDFICCLTVHVPNGGTTDLGFDFNGTTHEVKCVVDGTIICEADGIAFGAGGQPTNITNSNGFAWIEYDCNVPTCCVLLLVSRNEDYAGAGNVSYQYSIGGTLYGGSYVVTENGNTTLFRICYPAGTVILLVSVTADGVTTLYPGTGSIIEANHLDPQNRKIFSAALINECAECDCQVVPKAQISYPLPDDEYFIWFVNAIGSPYAQNTLFFLFNSGAARNNFRNFVNACNFDYIRASNNTNLHEFKKANLFFVTQMATATIPVPIVSPISAGYDKAIQYSYITPTAFDGGACLPFEQAAADNVNLMFLATLSASNNLRYTMTLLECLKLADDCGIYPPPCTLQITTVVQSCEAGSINVITNFLAPSMTGDVTVTVNSAVAPFGLLLPPYDTPAAILSTGFSIPLGTTDDFVILIESALDPTCFSTLTVTPIACNDCGACLSDSVFSEILVSGAAGIDCTGVVTARYQDAGGLCDWILCHIDKVLTIGSSYEVYPVNADPICTAIAVVQTGLGEFEVSGLGQGQYNCTWKLGACNNEDCVMDNFIVIEPIQLRRCTFYTPDSFNYQLQQYIHATGGFRLDITSILINGVEQLAVSPLSSVVTTLAQLYSESYPLQGSHYYNIWVQFCNNINALSIPNLKAHYSNAARLEPGAFQYGGDPYVIEYRQTDTVTIYFDVYDGLNVLIWTVIWDNTPLGGTIVNGTLWAKAEYCNDSDTNGAFPCETSGGIYFACNSATNPDSLQFGFQGVPLQQGEPIVTLWRVNGGAWTVPPFNVGFHHVFNWNILVNDPIFVTGFNTVNLLLKHIPNGASCLNQVWTKTVTFDNTNINNTCPTVIVT